MRGKMCVLVLLFALAGCSHEPPAYESHYTPATTTPAPPPVNVVVIGDSYANELQPLLDEEPTDPPTVFDVEALGGSGYVNRGYRNAVLGDAVAAVKPDTGLIVFFGSRNDITVPPEDVAIAARGAWNHAKEIAPQARLVVIGFPWVEGNPTPGALAIQDALRVQAEAAGAFFVDPIAEEWFFGMPELIGPDDKVHPNSAGRQYLADKIAPIIADQLHPTG